MIKGKQVRDVASLDNLRSEMEAKISNQMFQRGAR
jgi:hypothetical protein